jgi:hypothetical protein
LNRLARLNGGPWEESALSFWELKLPSREKVFGDRSRSQSIPVNKGFQQLHPGKSLNVIFRNQNGLILLLISIGIIGVFLIYYFSYRKKKKHIRNGGNITQEQRSMQSEGSNAEYGSPAQQASIFSTPQKPSGIWLDLLRGVLLILSLLIIAAVTLVLLPQRALDTIVHQFESRHSSPIQERIALLYLGDEIENGSFRIRGVVKNIAAGPIEKMDAAVRLYDREGSATKTVLIRLDKEVIDPGAIARLDLVIPNYKMDISGYAVEFQLRDGEKISYKDLRRDLIP